MLNLNKNGTNNYRPRVLIAQSDEEDLQLIEKHVLRFAKFDYILADRGTQVIQEINENCFDVVVLGLKFKDVTGTTLAYLIHEFDPTIPIVFLTSYSNVMLSGAEDVAYKVIEKENLEENLPSICEDIYNIAMEMDVANNDKEGQRNYKRPQYNTHRLALPTSIASSVARLS